MSLALFQSSLARLVTDLDFRACVLAGGRAALPAGLTRVERERLLAVARDPGLDATRTIHKSFRLSKLLLVLPLTRLLLGPSRFGREVAAFWAARPPVGFYYLDEALAFCEFLRGRQRDGGLKVPYLREVSDYEAASVSLERARLTGRWPAEQRVEFRHDPAQLLGALSEGRRPRGVSRARGTLVGSVGRAGKTRWRIEHG